MAEADLVSQVDLARQHGVRPATIRSWEAEGCPVESKAEKAGQASLYRSSEVINWRIRRAVEMATGGTKTAAVDEARRRKEVARAEAAEIDLAERRSDLVSISVVIEKLTDVFASLRGRLMGLGPRIAPRLEVASGVAAKRAVIDEAVTEALHDISSDPRDFVARSRSLRAATPRGDDRGVDAA